MIGPDKSSKGAFCTTTTVTHFIHNHTTSNFTTNATTITKNIVEIASPEFQI